MTKEVQLAQNRPQRTQRTFMALLHWSAEQIVKVLYLLWTLESVLRQLWAGPALASEKLIKFPRQPRIGGDGPI